MKIMKNQEGIVLIFSLILLAALTILAVSVMTTSIFQRKISGGSEDIQLAQQAAYSAIVDAKNWLSSQCFKPTPCSSGGTACKVWTAGSLTQPYNWNNAQSFSGTLSMVSTQPKYFIQETVWDNANGNQWYTIIARGFGSASDTTAVVLSTFVMHTPMIGANGTFPGNIVRLRSVSDGQYRIPGECLSFLGTYRSNSTLNDDQTWFMCVKQDGSVSFREHASTSSALKCNSSRYNLTQSTANNSNLVGLGYCKSGSDCYPTTNSDYTTQPTPYGFFVVDYMYTDANNTNGDGIAEPKVPKAVYLLQSNNNEWLAPSNSLLAYPFYILPNTANNTGSFGWLFGWGLSTQAGMATEPQPTSLNYFKIENIGTAPPDYSH